jgi:D-glycero-alpha-D-manno-heptose-7-phosphate kinase
MKESLQIGNLNDFGEILHQGWVLKKKMARNISNPVLDEYYEKALKAGIIGGKLLGAGGGGFFLFYCKQRNQEDVRKAINLKELNFKFDNEGSKIIYIGQ